MTIPNMDSNNSIDTKMINIHELRAWILGYQTAIRRGTDIECGLFIDDLLVRLSQVTDSTAFDPTDKFHRSIHPPIHHHIDHPPELGDDPQYDIRIGDAPPWQQKRNE